MSAMVGDVVLCSTAPVEDEPGEFGGAESGQAPPCEALELGEAILDLPPAMVEADPPFRRSHREGRFPGLRPHY